MVKVLTKKCNKNIWDSKKVHKYKYILPQLKFKCFYNKKAYTVNIQFIDSSSLIDIILISAIISEIRVQRRYLFLVFSNNRYINYILSRSNWCSVLSVMNRLYFRALHITTAIYRVQFRYQFDTNVAEIWKISGLWFHNNEMRWGWVFQE